MRVTNKMTIATVLRSLRQPVESMLQRQRAISTGQRLQRPSDDPVAVSQVQAVDSELRGIAQYQRNLGDAQAMLRVTESALAEYENLLVRAKELTVQAGNGSLDVGARQAIASEIDGILESVLTVANRQTQGRYVFGGTNTLTQPFRPSRDPSGEILTVQAGDISAKIYRDVDEDTTVEANIPGDTVFGGQGNIFETLIELRDAVRTGDQTVVLGALDRLETHLNASLDARVAVGTEMQRIEAVQSQLGDRETTLRQRKGELAEADLAEEVTQLRADEVAYQAGLSAAARVLGTSLVDFLR